MKKEDLKVGDYFRSSKEARNEIASAWRGFVELKSLWKVVEILNDGDFIVECFVTNRGKLINSSRSDGQGKILSKLFHITKLFN